MDLLRWLYKIFLILRLEIPGYLQTMNTGRRPLSAYLVNNPFLFSLGFGPDRGRYDRGRTSRAGTSRPSCIRRYRRPGRRTCGVC